MAMACVSSGLAQTAARSESSAASPASRFLTIGFFAPDFFRAAGGFAAGFFFFAAGFFFAVAIGAYVTRCKMRRGARVRTPLQLELAMKLIPAMSGSIPDMKRLRDR